MASSEPTPTAAAAPGPGPAPTPDPARIASRRRRRWPLVLLVLALLLAGASWMLARLLEPERLSRFLLRQASEATGLELRVAAPADIALWPDLHIRMLGLQAAHAGQAPVLTAERVDLVLPWSALLQRQAVVRHLRLLRPELDLQALSRWRTATAQPGPPAPLQVPQLTASLSIEDGTIRADAPAGAAGGAPAMGWRLSSVQLQTSALLEGAPFRAAASAVLQRNGGSAPVLLTMAVDTVPVVRNGVLLLDPLQLSGPVPGTEQELSVHGRLELDLPARLQVELSASMQEWPGNWPALPLPAAAGAGATAIALHYDGPLDGAGRVHGSATRGEASAQVQAVPAQLLAWNGNPARSPLPPASAGLDVPLLEFGGVQLHGVRARLQSPPEDAASDPPDGAQQ